MYVSVLSVMACAVAGADEFVATSVGAVREEEEEDPPAGLVT